MILRPYQQTLFESVRLSYREHRRVFMQLATGGGKTVIISQIVFNLMERKKRVWFVVPRNELLQQASDHFYRWKISHGIINAKSKESRAYLVHICSRETLMRRIKADKIKNFPDFLIVDEAHVAIDQQAAILAATPDEVHALGISATPERTDGRGLSDIYDHIEYGPEIPELQALGYLAPFKYFAPPLDGLDDLHRKGTDYDATELEALLKRRAIYGQAIKHYRELADGQPCIVFCRNIKSAEDTAARFRDAGYRFESVDGRMADGKRKAILDGVRSGELHGVTSVDLCIYGLDIPRLTVAIMLRPTISKAVYYQQIGRILRPEDGKTAIIIDHVNNIGEFGNPATPQDWNFYGREKRKRKGKSLDTLKICPHCFLYFSGAVCDNCGEASKKRRPAGMVEVDGRLVEHKGPVPLQLRDDEERREIQDRIGAAIDSYTEAEGRGEIDYSAVEEMVKLQEELGYKLMWTYHKLNTLNRAVNVPLLHAIGKVKGYSPYWAKKRTEEMQRRNR